MNELEKMLLVTLGDQEYTHWDEIVHIFDGQTESHLNKALKALLKRGEIKLVPIDDSEYYTRTMTGCIALHPDLLSSNDDIPF